MDYRGIVYKSLEDKNIFVAEGVEINQVACDRSLSGAANGLARAIDAVFEERLKNTKVELSGEHSEEYNKIIKEIDFSRQPKSILTLKDGSKLRIYEHVDGK